MVMPLFARVTAVKSSSVEDLCMQFLKHRREIARQKVLFEAAWRVHSVLLIVSKANNLNENPRIRRPRCLEGEAAVGSSDRAERSPAHCD